MWTLQSNLQPSLMSLRSTLKEYMQLYLLVLKMCEYESGPRRLLRSRKETSGKAWSDACDFRVEVWLKFIFVVRIGPLWWMWLQGLAWGRFEAPQKSETWTAGVRMGEAWTAGVDRGVFRGSSSTPERGLSLEASADATEGPRWQESGYENYFCYLS